METTTAPPETTASPFSPEETAVRQAIQDYFVAYIACGSAPETCDPASYLASKGPARAAMTATVAALLSTGEYFGPDIRGSYIVSESVRFRSRDQALATSCWFDAGLLLGPDGPDGKPTVVSESITSGIVFHTLYREGGTWRVGEERSGTELGEGNQCPPSA